ncbi:MAG: hypothetical protein PHE89_02805 [Alphaproteobacteria bacterium]|nr:hypothetical protein [Alphaproteobacteria bacterium]
MTHIEEKEDGACLPCKLPSQTWETFIKLATEDYGAKTVLGFQEYIVVKDIELPAATAKKQIRFYKSGEISVAGITITTNATIQDQIQFLLIFSK